MICMLAFDPLLLCISAILGLLNSIRNLFPTLNVRTLNKAKISSLSIIRNFQYLQE